MPEVLSLDQLIDQGGDVSSPRVPPRAKYVSPARDGGPFEALLWQEVRRIERSSRMTEWQSVVFEWYLMGYSHVEIAMVFGRHKTTIKQHLDLALAKASTCRTLGVFTVLVEEIGWSAVQQLTAERQDLQSPCHPLAARSRKIAAQRRVVPEIQAERSLKVPSEKLVLRDK